MQSATALTASPDLAHDNDKLASTEPSTSVEDDASLRRRNVNIPEASAEKEGPRRQSTTYSRRPSRQGTFSERIRALFEPEHRVGQEPTFRQSAIAVVKASWLNVLLVFIPVSWALHFVGSISDTLRFVLAFIAIIPLAKLLGFGTEEIALRVGQTLGGLVNATLGNAVELIVAIIALKQCQLEVVQSSLLGSILSNLLLVLGSCFLAGGLRFSEQAFKPAGVQANSSLLLIAVIAISIPSAYHAAFGTDLTDQVELSAILSMSRGTAVIVFVTYFAFLVFQLYTHDHLFAIEEKDPVAKPTWGNHAMFKPARSARVPRTPVVPGTESGEGAVADLEEDEEVENPQLNVTSAIILLIGVTVLVAFTAEFLVDSINGLTEAHPDISKAWVGLILLPIVGNAAEHVTAVTVAYKDKLDLSIGVAVGSSIQISLFVIPLLIIIAWGLNKPLSLLFDPFEAVTLFLSVLIVNYVVADNRSNWLEGWVLISVYLIIAVSFWYYPSVETSTSALLNTCT